MNKALWALPTVALLGAASAVAVIVASPDGEEEAAVQLQETATASPSSTADASVAAESPTAVPSSAACDPNATPTAGTKLWRWGDVTVMILEGSGVRALGDFGAEAQPVLAIYPEEDNSARTIVDAQTGAVLADDPQGDKESAIEAAVTTISVCPLDPSTAPWPYTGDEPEAPRMTLGKVSYLEPDPATGIQVLAGAASGNLFFLDVRSARSSMYVSLETGEVIGASDRIAPEDQEAFKSFLAATRIEAQ